MRQKALCAREPGGDRLLHGPCFVNQQQGRDYGNQRSVNTNWARVRFDPSYSTSVDLVEQPKPPQSCYGPTRRQGGPFIGPEGRGLGEIGQYMDAPIHCRSMQWGEIVLVPLIWHSTILLVVHTVQYNIIVEEPIMSTLNMASSVYFVFVFPYLAVQSSKTPCFQLYYNDRPSLVDYSSEPKCCPVVLFVCFFLLVSPCLFFSFRFLLSWLFVSEPFLVFRFMIVCFSLCFHLNIHIDIFGFASLQYVKKLFLLCVIVIQNIQVPSSHIYTLHRQRKMTKTLHENNKIVIEALLIVLNRAHIRRETSPRQTGNKKGKTSQEGSRTRRDRQHQ